MKTPLYAVYVTHPDTQQPAWFGPPGEGWSFDINEACLWEPQDLADYIHKVREEGGDWGTRHGEYPCRIRQVWATAC